ncbi:MAG: ribonuclease R [Bdellovibrio sp.]
MNKTKKLQQGMIKRHPDGFGFFIPDDTELPDVYVPRHSMNGVMTNDKVVISVEAERGTDRFRGDIVRIVERGTKKIVGIFTPLPNGGGLIKDEGKGWGSDLKIKATDTMGCEKGQMVAVEILSFADDGKAFTGKVVQVIGSSADPLNDIIRVVHTLNIPSEFSPKTLKEASFLKPQVDEKDFKGRKDLRALRFVTIDGATAKDFDDAIFIEQNEQGFLLYVAIADVSHYVRPGSAIDDDAAQRGTSVYFPNFVIPMLPEILSNELCSLNPHIPRLSLVAEIQMDFTGHMTSSDFYEAVIESHARVTYGEAQELVEGIEIEKFKHVADDIRRAADLAKILMAKRFREGSLDLEIPETQLMIDSAGNPVDIIRSERLFAHRLIEEMMLAANVAVAKFLSQKEVPALYRVHEEPNPDAIALLERYLRNFGGNIKLDQGKLQKRLTKALQEFDGKPEAQVLNTLTLRSMSQAKYSANNLGHFGLGFEFYTHFTSPIRRYPDLIIHRLIKSQVMKNSNYRLMAEEDLQSAGTMLSACEQRAAKAERQIQAIKKARFMQKHIGEEFDGVVSSVTKFGVFVLLRQFEIDGLVHIDNLSGPKFERFEFDEENLRLVSKRSGFSYTIGDPIKIRVSSSDVVEGKIDFELADAIPSEKSASTRPGSKNREPGGRNPRHVAARRERSAGPERSRGSSSERPKSDQRRPEKSNDRPRASAERPTAKTEKPMGADWKKQAGEESRSERFMKQNARALGDVPDELDLDALPVDDHADSLESTPQTPGKFDPGAKLEEALRKRGLKPGAGRPSQESSGTAGPQRLAFGKKEQPGRVPDEMIDRRRRFRREEDRDDRSAEDEKKSEQWWPRSGAKKASGSGGKSKSGGKPKQGSKKSSGGGGGGGKSSRGPKPSRRGQR